MDYSLLEENTYGDLKKMAKEMGLQSRKSKSEYIADIQQAFGEYEKYKTTKVDKYTRIRQLGNKGKEGTTYLVKDLNNREFAMKTFRKTKSSNTLKNEYTLQKIAAKAGIAPRVVEYDSVSKYIVMEKMDIHLVDVMKKQDGNLLKWQQNEIIDIFKTLDKVGVFHADSNILNYMMKSKKIYLIDFGFSKEITSRLCKKLGTDSPNMRMMTLGLVLKLKEMKCPPSAWKYLRVHISKEECDRFNIE
jgi:tRNA A-37 threonylcarbamoyl transferase component Bud32